jgi:hypothetical protein
MSTHTKGDDKIALIGVENWGFQKAGDINKASDGVRQEDLK